MGKRPFGATGAIAELAERAAGARPEALDRLDEACSRFPLDETVHSAFASAPGR